MSYESLVKKSVANTAAAATEIKTILESMGWTTHDDQSSASPPYYVFSSTGENSDLMTGYLQVMWSNTTDKIETYQYLYWDNSTHSGTSKIYPGAYAFLSVDDDASFYLWVCGNKDQIHFATLVGSTYNHSHFAHLKPFYKTEGVIQSGVSSGSNVVLQLASGEETDFVVGRNYRVVGSGSGEGSEETTITVVDTTNHRVTVDSLTRSLSADSKIGPMPYRWSIISAQSYASCIPNTYSGTGTYDTGTSILITHPFTQSYLDPDQTTHLYEITPLFIAQLYGNYIGYTDSNFGQMYVSTSSEHTFSIGDQDSGTATSGTSTTLTDSSKTWTSNEWANKCLIIIGGTGEGQMRKITSNTATEITVPAFITNPDSTSEYVICNNGYRYFYATSNNDVVFREV